MISVGFKRVSKNVRVGFALLGFKRFGTFPVRAFGLVQ